MTDYDYYDCDYSGVIEPWRKYRLFFPIAHVEVSITYRKGKRGKACKSVLAILCFTKAMPKKAILNLKRMLHLVGM